jgi:hypothetical protein
MVTMTATRLDLPEGTKHDNGDADKNEDTQPAKRKVLDEG